MNKMPEVYDNYEDVKRQINSANQIILYATPEVAQWMVDKDFEPTLRQGEAVKISRWEDSLTIVPVKWIRMPETSQWNWKEVGRPYTRNIGSDALP